jgi:hypothetical protein
MSLKDVAWFDRFEDGLAAARKNKRILLAKPAGQGIRCEGGIEYW